MPWVCNVRFGQSAPLAVMVCPDSRVPRGAHGPRVSQVVLGEDGVPHLERLPVPGGLEPCGLGSPMGLGVLGPQRGPGSV